MIAFRLKGWKPFGVNHDRRVIKTYLSKVRSESRRVFTRGLTAGPHTGRIYARGAGSSHQASVNIERAEFPHSDSGNLLASMRDRQNRNSATIGTGAAYSGYLADGTPKMQARRMSAEALRSGAMLAKPHSRGWLKFKKGKQRVRSI